MPQLSEVTPSRIGSVFLTTNGLETGGQLCLVFWDEADRGALARVVDDVIGSSGPAAEVQESELSKDGWPLTLKLTGATDVLYAALRAQCDTPAAEFDAVLNLAATDGAGAERAVSFPAVKWVNLAPDPSIRFAVRLYQNVLAKLVGVAA